MTALTAAAILALVANPACGNVPENTDLARHLVATAMKESGGDPLIIGVNADLSRALPAGKVLSATTAEAVTNARALLAQGRHIDLGLFQISDANLSRHHLTVATAFDQCRNTVAGTEHLADDFRAAAWTLAHRRYQCGGFDCGVGYAAQFDVLAASGVPDATVPPEAIPPRADPATLPLRDALHGSDSTGLTDLFVHPPKKAPVPTEEKPHDQPR